MNMDSSDHLTPGCTHEPGIAEQTVQAAAGTEVSEHGPDAERLSHRRDGRYLIAPDSAEPLPSTIWTRGDIATVTAAAERANERVIAASTESRSVGAPGSIFHVTAASRAYLERIGGEPARQLLDGLEHVEQGGRVGDPSLGQ